MIIQEICTQALMGMDDTQLANMVLAKSAVRDFLGERGLKRNAVLKEHLAEPDQNYIVLMPDDCGEVLEGWRGDNIRLTPGSSACRTSTGWSFTQEGRTVRLSPDMGAGQLWLRYRTTLELRPTMDLPDQIAEPMINWVRQRVAAIKQDWAAQKYWWGEYLRVNNAADTNIITPGLAQDIADILNG